MRDGGVLLYRRRTATNVERMLRAVLQRGGTVGCCGSCSDTRALTDETCIEGAERSSLDELTDWTLWADRVITF